jgi:dTDP-4-dehydrorhamnose 3,5-epimerase
MKIIDTGFAGLYVFEPKVFGDSRGYFLESFNYQAIKEVLGEIQFVQDNESLSKRGVLRGLHFQLPPYAQSKLVRVVQGAVLDVVVDMRKNADSFGKSYSIELSGENKKQLFIPAGFAHGFVVLSEMAIFAYKVDNYYAPQHERGVLYNDPQLAIDWRIDSAEFILSDKDKLNPLFKNAENPF